MNCTVIATDTNASDTKMPSGRFPGGRGSADCALDRMVFPMAFFELVAATGGDAKACWRTAA